MRKLISVLGLCVVLSLQYGCAKRIAVSYDHLEVNTLVHVKTKSGTTATGIVEVKKPDYLLLNTDLNGNSMHKIEKSNIHNIYFKPPIYDYENNVISEWEISKNQKNKNKFLYTLGGGGISFGASFFMGSMIYRQLSESNKSRGAILWSTTGIGTTIGSYLFFIAGKYRDREASIWAIKEKRYSEAKKDIEEKKARSTKIKSELEKEKAARAKQDAEMKRLKEELKKKEKEESE